MDGFKFICDKAAIKAQLQRAWDKVLPQLTDTILSETNEFVREDSSAMRKSSYTASNVKDGEIIWNTPYAKRVYYTGDPSKEKNPRATTLWCEAAKREYGKDWEKRAQKLFGGE